MVCSGVKIKVNLLWLSTSGQQSGSLPFESIVFQIFAETVLRHYQRMMNTVGSHLHVESEQEKLIEIRNRLVVSRVEGEMDIGQKYKLELEDE